jgi:hypothetical protein
MNALLWLYQFAFGCHHRHMSRVFTIKHRTYRVCFDCGHEFDLPDVHTPLGPGLRNKAA